MVLAPVLETQTLTFERTTHAPVEQVYNAFLARDTLYYWLCDDAHVRGEVGGHVLLSWAVPRSFVTGQFKALDKNQFIAFTWREPDREETDVEVEIEEADGGIKIVLRHTGDFEDAAAQEKRWHKSLDNLVSFLETGADLRIANRVIIGIFPDALSKEKAQSLGVPVETGTLVTGLVPGYSAEKAGLQVDDVIVGMNGHEVTSETPMNMLIGENKPGDKVEVEYYRGSEKHAAMMELKGYPLPAIPADFVAYADQLEKIYADINTELSALFADISEVHASQKPAPNEWSANETVAHLILTERWLQNWLGGLLQGPEITGYTGNTDARIQAVTAIYNTKDAILDAFQRTMAETIAVIRHFPAAALERKSNLWWVAFEFHGFPVHTRNHFKQIQEAIAAART
jgi:uncharacterized protein YndB with AHSA1/START domain